MQKFEVFFFPMTCARVTMAALEMTGAEYDVTVINLFSGEQHGPGYREINPAGKVPALRIGSRILTENAAIILYLEGLYPDAALLPAGNAWTRASIISDLIWCASTLHPTARMLRVPAHYTIGDQEPVRAKGREAITPLLNRMEQAVAGGAWWRGGDWSMIDVYIGWIFGNVVGTGFDVSAFPGLRSHGERVGSHPAYERMFAREGEAMDEAGVALPPGMVRYRP